MCKINHKQVLSTIYQLLNSLSTPDLMKGKYQDLNLSLYIIIAFIYYGFSNPHTRGNRGITNLVPTHLQPLTSDSCYDSTAATISFNRQTDSCHTCKDSLYLTVEVRKHSLSMLVLVIPSKNLLEWVINHSEINLEGSVFVDHLMLFTFLFLLSPSTHKKPPKTARADS